MSDSESEGKEEVVQETVQQKRCAREGCKTFYTDDTEECWYHPGKWIDPLLTLDPERASKGAIVGWSCCRYGQLAGFPYETMVKTAKGCKREARHLEDIEYSAIVNRFPTVSTTTIPHKKSEVTTTEDVHQKLQQKEEEQGEEPIDKEQFLLYKLKSTDTLAGISLKFGVSIDVLKRANHLFNHTIAHLKQIKIPKSENEDEEMSHTQAVRSFRMRVGQTQCDMSEAKFYLEEAGWDVQRAVEAFSQDTEWEKEAGRRTSQAISERGRASMDTKARCCVP